MLASWESVTELQPRMDDISKCPGKLIIVTAAAPEGSFYDFCSRVFAPKLGVDEVKKFSMHFHFSLKKTMNFHLTSSLHLHFFCLVLCSFRIMYVEVHIVH